jgi:hypothetical protein
MIVKYVKNNNGLDMVNKIDIIRVNRRPKRGSNFRMLLFLCMCIIFAFLLISFSSDSVVAVSGTITGEQEDNVRDMQMFLAMQDSGRILLEQNVATASGAAIIPEDTAQGKLLGRRGALTDARRNLLVLRQKLIEDPDFSVKKVKRNIVSGIIAGVVIHSEVVKNNVYILQVDVPLDKLMEGEIDIDIDIE